MSDDKLSQATKYDITMNEDGDYRVAPDRYTTFGKAHGGHDQLVLLITIAKAVAFIGILPLAWWLGSTDLSTTTKGALALAYLGSILAFDIVVVFLYIRLRYVLIGFGILIAMMIAGLATLALIAWGVSLLF